MLKYLLTSISLILSLGASAQFVKDEVASEALIDLLQSTADWGDFDKDGDPDLAIGGSAGTEYAEIYRNDNGTFVNIDAGITPIDDGSIMWGDYDNDKDLDLLLSGVTSTGEGPEKVNFRITSVFRNDNGLFTDIEAGLQGVSNGNTIWGDFDNDDDLDIAFIGTTDEDNTNDVLKVYRNDNGIFNSVTLPIQPSSINNSGSVSWGDYDNDLDLDLLVTGLGVNEAGDDLITAVLRNDDGVFVDAMIDLPGLSSSHGEWGDYDDDDDLDIALSGVRFDNQYLSVIYRNDDGIYTDIEAELENTGIASVAWGDYDTDNDLDLLVTGISSVTFLPSTKLYRNDAGTFTDASVTLPETWGRAKWGDYDGDSDPDLLLTGVEGELFDEFTEVYENVLKQGQSITFSEIPEKVYGDVFELEASASSMLSVEYEVIEGSANLTGNTIVITSMGEVTIEASHPGNEDFLPAPPVQQTFTVNQALLTVTANNISLTFGDPIPDLTYQYAGFVNGEDASVLISEPSVTTTATAGSNAGSYSISLSGGEATNYAFILAGGTLTIDPATATLTISNLEQVYDGNPKEATVLTDPPGLDYDATYNGLEEPPVEVGSYDLVVNIVDLNHIGQSTATFVIQMATGAQNNLSKKEVTIFPVPTRSVISFLGNINDLVTAEVHSLRGDIVMTQDLAGANQVDISHLIRGIYLLRLFDGAGRMKTSQRIIVD